MSGEDKREIVVSINDLVERANDAMLKMSTGNPNKTLILHLGQALVALGNKYHEQGELLTRIREWMYLQDPDGAGVSRWIEEIGRILGPSLPDIKRES